MEKLIRRITNIAVIALTGVTGVFGLYVMFNGDKFQVGGENPMAMDIAFYLMYLMFFIGVALILVFGLMQIISSKKLIIMAMALIVAAVAVFGVCYWLAPNELSEVAMRMGITEGAYKLVGAMLNFVYAMVIALGSTFLGMLVYTKIKNR
jgi:hypothetical protein